ncbi:MAG TPA: NAD(P)H-hydrate dehydratase [Burkholderiales bacterium]|nr:NAD(P)H-hydrate dehydratase [Burkholderiales bacterium]
MSRPIYLTEDIRRIESAAGAVRPTLMVRAGEAAAALALQLVPDKGKDVLVLAGPGNNGGDAYEAAARLKAAFLRVTLVSPADPAKLPPDAAEALRKWQAAGGETLREVPAGPRWSLVVDGLFGIGLTREPQGEYARLIELANAQSCPVLALDIPSGLASDTGRVLGQAVRATHTVTFIALKPGLLTLAGPDHCGVLQVAELGLDVRSLLAPKGWVAEPATMRWVLKPRLREFHKGRAGSLGVLGGASGMVGAALLAGRAALKLGAGRVYVGLLDHEAPEVDPLAPELMLRHPDDALGQSLDTIVVGPGLGQSERAQTLLGAALASDMPCVLDADALNLLADDSDLRNACARRRADTIITPHPGEAARLLQTRVPDVQDDRLATARALAERLNAHTVLKGNGSVLVATDGHWFVNTAGNPGMASAGMGDTLSGFLGALLAQGYSGEAALVLGVHLHGAAADALVAQGVGPVGLTAGELIEPARALWNDWLRG